jgi:hypothetical protein
MKKICSISALALLVVTAHAAAAVFIPVSLPDRARGAERIVVASVENVTATWETNEFGDKLIVSHVTLRVEESLKGRSTQVLSMDLDGGTIGNLTLQVSSLPKLSPGERAVFFLATGRSDHYVPHLRGQGILKLDAQNKVRGSSVDLNTIRATVASVVGR